MATVPQTDTAQEPEPGPQVTAATHIGKEKEEKQKTKNE